MQCLRTFMEAPGPTGGGPFADSVTLSGFQKGTWQSSLGEQLFVNGLSPRGRSLSE